jgi:hypothetical protein
LSPESKIPKLNNKSNALDNSKLRKHSFSSQLLHDNPDEDIDVNTQTNYERVQVIDDYTDLNHTGSYLSKNRFKITSAKHDHRSINKAEVFSEEVPVVKQYNPKVFDS